MAGKNASSKKKSSALVEKPKPFSMFTSKAQPLFAGYAFKMFSRGNQQFQIR